MEYKKIKKGEYSFKGIDNLTGKEINGIIKFSFYDTTVKTQWQVIFNIGTMNVYRPFTASSLKECKNWLTD